MATNKFTGAFLKVPATRQWHREPKVRTPA